ncbi:MAG: NADP-dependent phosphogluconate dehydrogenase [Eubacteriales bacterium]|nr:NADP-dependent phosphogluconate dehydrogenase [Eubacteriales bacterium]
MKKMANIGVIGLKVMGRNLALNLADHGYRVALYNRTVSVVDEVMAAHPHENFVPTDSPAAFVNSLEKPRRIILMVKAGAAVDALADTLCEYLEPGDIIMDGGNSFYKDTVRRTAHYAARGIHFMGTGISGGEEGARFGPAIMPGGSPEAYAAMGPILEDIAAKVAGEPCCNYVGPDGAGHYVKMVHNGIEYADMQAISEAYLLLKNVAGLNNEQLHEVFAEWNEGELESYLVEITRDIFATKDEEGYVLDTILDVSRQKGTGKWTALEAIELGVDTSVLYSGLNARYMSMFKAEREQAAKQFDKKSYNICLKPAELTEMVRQSLYLTKIMCYAQGFALLKAAGQAYGWDLNFVNVTKLFRGGCIIRAKFLQEIIEAFSESGAVDNLMLTAYFGRKIEEYLPALRQLITVASNTGTPIPAIMSAMTYFDAYTTATGGASLVQAQRDYFGAHTYERKDRSGSFHFDWVAYHGNK